MLTIRRGQGWAVFPIYFGTFVVVMLCITQLVPGADKEGYASAHGWPVAISLGLPGFINIVWGLRTNWQPPVMVVDPENGMRRLIRVRHSFYYVPVEYWGISGAALALLAYYLMPTRARESARRDHQPQSASRQSADAPRVQRR